MVRAKQYRLGLLFVHGMGEQERGDTITQMGDALTEWLRRWIDARGAGFRIRAATLREEGGASTGPSARVSVVLTDEKGVAQEWWYMRAMRSSPDSAVHRQSQKQYAAAAAAAKGQERGN